MTLLQLFAEQLPLLGAERRHRRRRRNCLACFLARAVILGSALLAPVAVGVVIVVLL
jgi:hypothetical protein